MVFRPGRRPAAATAVVIDGGGRIDVPHGGDRRFDPRLPGSRQAGHPVCAGNLLDKGHLVRRLDPVRGTGNKAATADSDPFQCTNAAPQADVFNQGGRLWPGLGDFLLGHAERFDRRPVFTGPVLADSDPLYRGIGVPLRFWKVAAFVQDGEPASTAYAPPLPGGNRPGAGGGGEGRGELLRSDFGLTWNAALETGGVLVSDRIRLTFDISAIRKPA